jgi:hypothetical protein
MEIVMESSGATLQDDIDVVAGEKDERVGLPERSLGAMEIVLETPEMDDLCMQDDMALVREKQYDTTGRSKRHGSCSTMTNRLSVLPISPPGSSVNSWMPRGKPGPWALRRKLP